MPGVVVKKIDLSLTPPSITEIEAERARMNALITSLGNRINAIAIAGITLPIIFSAWLLMKFGLGYIALLFVACVSMAAFTRAFSRKVESIQALQFMRSAYMCFAVMMVLSSELSSDDSIELYVTGIVGTFCFAMYLPLTYMADLVKKRSDVKHESGRLDYIENNVCAVVMGLVEKNDKYPLIDNYVKNIRKIGRKLIYLEYLYMRDYEWDVIKAKRAEKDEAACKKLYFGEMLQSEQ